MNRASPGSYREFAERLTSSSHGAPPLKQFLDLADDTYWERAEAAYRGLMSYALAHQLTSHDILDHYAAARKDTLARTFYFRKTGRYPDAQGGQSSANDVHYSDDKNMRKGMISLALTQFLWPHHYKLYDFFIAMVRSVSEDVTSYLEIGPGHGLFLSVASTLLPRAQVIQGVDISEASLQITESMVHCLGISSAVTLLRADATTLAPASRFDLVTAGEIIEHLDDPKEFLQTLSAMLSPSGHLFLTTCANCPDATHAYQFNDIDEIRRLLTTSGLRIDQDCVAPSADLPADELTRRRISLSYGALLSLDR